MKQLILVLLLLGGGYYLYNNGFLNVIKQAKIDPKSFIGEIKGAAGAVSYKGLPEKNDSRGTGLKGADANIKLVENTIFATYDANTCYAYTEMAYMSGSNDSEKIITRYLANFTLPEEKNKILTLVTRYKDKQTLEILRQLFNRGTFSRKMLLNKIAEYRSPEVVAIIQQAKSDSNMSVSKEAEAIDARISQESWYSTGGKKMKLQGEQLANIVDAPLPH